MIPGHRIRDLAVTLRPVKGLAPYAKNSRTHSPRQVAQIAAAIGEWGWTSPLLIDERDGIIAGHGRVLAAEKLGIAEVPCIVLPGLTEAQKRALVIADNKLALNAGWDEDLLVEELGDLNADGFDLTLTGFEHDEIEKLLGEVEIGPGDGLTDPDVVPDAPVHPVSARGDLWLLGSHRILCGDSTDALDAERAGAGEATVTLSDPPYGIGYSYESHDDGDNAANAQLVWDAFTNGPEVRIWTPGLPNLARDISRFGKAKVLVWSKKFAAAGSGLGGASTWEPILVVGKPPERRLANDVIEQMTERVEVDGVSLRKLHTCPKPVALYERLLQAFTAEGCVVFEPFSGSGTTLLACERTGRACRAVEIEPRYVDVAIRRWMAHTGQEAVLAGDGRTFSEVSSARPIGGSAAAGPAPSGAAAAEDDAELSMILASGGPSP